jgi:hypothetical protein
MQPRTRTLLAWALWLATFGCCGGRPGGHPGRDWEFNNFEVIVRDGRCYPIDFGNATPDMAIISLHYYFPWALAKWSLYCVVTGRAMRLDTEMARWYAVADDPARSWEEKLAAYRGLVDDYYKADRFREFCDTHLDHAEECMAE